MNTEKRQTLLECRSARAGDKSRFINADDIGDWFAKMMIVEINDFMNMFTCRDIIKNDLANDWKETIKFVCRPKISELKSLRKFWSQTDKSHAKDDYRSVIKKPSEMRKIWFNMADAGEVARRKQNPEKQREWMALGLAGWPKMRGGVNMRENLIFRDLISADKGWECEVRKGNDNYELSPYFKRMADELNGLRVVITSHYGWLFYRGFRLQCFGYDVDSGAGWDNTDYLEKYLDEYGRRWDTDNDNNKYKLWENVLFKKRFMIKINNACVKALWNPHCEFGRKHAEALYDENFGE